MPNEKMKYELIIEMTVLSVYIECGGYYNTFKRQNINLQINENCS